MSNGKKVLVTGVTAGVGNALGPMLRERGYHVIAVCRNAQQSEELIAQKICDATVLADLGIADAVQTVPQQLKDQGVSELAGFLHCAAISGAAPLETYPMDGMRQIFEVNVFGFMGVLQAVIPLLRPCQGRMVLTGSVAGFSAWPLLGMYGATKHAFEALCDVARRELWPWGIKVSLIRPGGIRTRMLARHIVEMKGRLAALAGKDKELYPRLYQSYTQMMIEGEGKAVAPEYVAKKIVEVFESANPKADYCVGPDCKLMRVIDLLLPDAVMDLMIKKIFALN